MMIMNAKFSLLAVAFVALASSSVVASPTGGVGGIQKRHQHVARAQQNQNSSSHNVNPVPVARGNGKKRRATGKAARCAAKSSSSAAAAVESTTSKADATTTKEQPTTTSTRHTTTTTKTSATPKATPKTSDDDGDSGSGSNSSDDPYSGDGTYYGVGNNACGGIDHEPDMIAAVAHGFFDSFPGATANPNLNPICGKSLTATYQGRSVVVKITDKCMGCVTEALDFSEAAFKKLTGGSLTAGRIHGVTWHWN